MPGRPSLVIFDCDGVLVDTEPVTLRAMREWVAEQGLPLTDAEVAERFKGVELAEIRRQVEAAVGRVLDGFEEGYRERMFAGFEAGVPEIPGAGDLLDRLRAAGIPLCVASNGPRAKMAVSLRASGLEARLGGLEGGLVFSAYDIGVFKPAPGLFLHAAEAMGGHEPRRCVVIEDSTSGVAAAKAAGMRCIAYADITPAGVLRAAGADEVVTSLAEVPALLGC